MTRGYPFSVSVDTWKISYRSLPPDRTDRYAVRYRAPFTSRQSLCSTFTNRPSVTLVPQPVTSDFQIWLTDSARQGRGTTIFAWPTRRANSSEPWQGAAGRRILDIPRARNANDVERTIAAMPKVELHVHLEGSVRPSTLLRLARRASIDAELGCFDEASVARFFQFRDCNHFIGLYGTRTLAFKNPNDFELVTMRLIVDHVRDFPAEDCFQTTEWCVEIREQSAVALGSRISDPEIHITI